MSTPGSPDKVAPYTSSSPVVSVSCDSQRRSSPSHGKCGLASSSPPPVSLSSAPIAQPLEPRVVSGVVSAGASTTVVSVDPGAAGVDGAAAAGGSAVAIGSINAPLDASSTTSFM